MRIGSQNITNNENNENNNYKIIAVDDEEGIIDSLSIFLKRSGYDFTGVTNPEEAIEKVIQYLFLLFFNFRLCY